MTHYEVSFELSELTSKGIRFYTETDEDGFEYMGFEEDSIYYPVFHGTVIETYEVRDLEGLTEFLDKGITLTVNRLI